MLPQNMQQRTNFLKVNSYHSVKQKYNKLSHNFFKGIAKVVLDKKSAEVQTTIEDELTSSPENEAELLKEQSIKLSSPSAPSSKTEISEFFLRCLSNKQLLTSII